MFELSQSDVHLLCGPVYHSGPGIFTALHQVLGSTIVAQRKFDPENALDLIERTAKRGAREIELLPREFKLLEYLMRRPEQVITRDMLLHQVWHYRFLPQTNVVDVHIGKLRRKIDIPGAAPLFKTERGLGYMLHANS